MTDLFGQEITREYQGKHPQRLLFKILPHYRKAAPEGQNRCSTCAKCCLFESRSGRRWRKCALVCGGSPATDVKARWVCDAWEKAKEDGR